MHRRVIDLVIFAAGAATGAAATYAVLNKKYAIRAEEEIAAVREVYACKKAGDRLADGIAEGLDKPNEDLVEAVSNYQRLVTDCGYENEEKKGGEDMARKPYVISPDEFDELEDYETESLNYYSDGVLTDDYDNIIEDVDYMVGSDFADHFGEYEDDRVCVRNPRQQIDYEILIDHRTFVEVVGGPPDQGD